MKKRIIAAFLTAVMAVCPLSAYAMRDSEVRDRVTSFGWIDAGYDQTASVTRSDFAKMMVKFGGYTPSGDTRSSFADIENGDERLQYINIVCQNGIMSPYLNNRFDPDGYVTMQQVAKGVLTVLGYQSWAEKAGGYPGGYLKTAFGTDMFDGIQCTAEDIMTYGDIAVVLANSATIPLCEMTLQNGFTTYLPNENKNILTKVFDTVEVKGKIISNSITAIGNASAIKGSVVVQLTNGQMLSLKDEDNKAGPYVGYNATIYYRLIDNIETLAYIVPNSNTEEVEFAIPDINSYSGGAYTYYADGSRKTARITSDADVIYNGKKVSDISGFKDASYMYFPRDNDDMPKDGKIRLVSSDGSSRYDLVFVDVMECYAVDHYSTANEAIYFKNNAAPAEIDDEYKYDIYDIDGNPVNPTELAEWDILETYRATDGSYTKYIAVRNTVEGTVEGVSDGDVYPKVTIDGQSYECYDNSKLTLGKKGVFLLSSTGRIVMMTDDVKYDATFGYLVNSWCEDYETVGSARILTMDGNLETYKMAKSILVDGVRFKKYSEISPQLQNRQLIAYELRDGELSKIDTVNQISGGTSDNLKLIYANTADSSVPTDEKNTGLIYKKNLNCFGGKIIADADTKMIVVPDKDSSFSNYTIKNLTGLKNDENYRNLQAYTVGDSNGKAMVIVQEVEGGIDNDFADDSNIAVVVDLITGINAQGEEAQGMTVYMNGTLVDVFGEDMQTLGKYEGSVFYPLSVGDIVRYATDANGIISGWKDTANGTKIGGIDPIYVQSYSGSGYDGLTKTDSFENNIYGTGRRFACCVYERVDNFIGVAVKSQLSQVSPEDGDVVYFAANNANVYIYDTDRKKVTVGSIDDLEAYKTVGEDCSRVYVSAFKGELKDVVIFK